MIVKGTLLRVVETEWTERSNLTCNRCFYNKLQARSAAGFQFSMPLSVNYFKESYLVNSTMDQPNIGANRRGKI